MARGAVSEEERRILVKFLRIRMERSGERERKWGGKRHTGSEDDNLRNTAVQRLGRFIGAFL